MQGHFLQPGPAQHDMSQDWETPRCALDSALPSQPPSPPGPTDSPFWNILGTTDQHQDLEHSWECLTTTTVQQMVTKTPEELPEAPPSQAQNQGMLSEAQTRGGRVKRDPCTPAAGRLRWHVGPRHPRASQLSCYLSQLCRRPGCLSCEACSCNKTMARKMGHSGFPTAQPQAAGHLPTSTAQPTASLLMTGWWV